MFREHWREREFLAWWFHAKLSRQSARAVATAATFVVLAGAGVFVAINVSSAESRTTQTILWQTITVQRNGAGRRVGSVSHVRSVVRYATVRNLRTVVVTRKRLLTDTAVVTRIVVKRQTVARAIPRLVTRTITRSKPRPSAETVTQLVTETMPPVTETETLPAETVFVTVTVKHGH